MRRFFLSWGFILLIVSELQASSTIAFGYLQCKDPQEAAIFVGKFKSSFRPKEFFQTEVSVKQLPILRRQVIDFLEEHNISLVDLQSCLRN